MREKESKRENEKEIKRESEWKRDTWSLMKRRRWGDRERKRVRVVNPVLTTTCLTHKNYIWSIKYFKLDQDENVYWNIFNYIVLHFHDTVWG